MKGNRIERHRNVTSKSDFACDFERYADDALSGTQLGLNATTPLRVPTIWCRRDESKCHEGLIFGVDSICKASRGQIPEEGEKTSRSIINGSALKLGKNPLCDYKQGVFFYVCLSIKIADLRTNTARDRRLPTRLRH